MLDICALHCATRLAVAKVIIFCYSIIKKYQALEVFNDIL